MHQHRGARCPLLVLLCPVLLATVGGQGPLECWEKAVSADEELQLQLEKAPQGWVKVEWKVKLDAGDQHRILTAEKNKNASFSKGPFSERAVFQQKTFSLRISPVSRADSGVYIIEFEDTLGQVSPLCFHVSVWEPVHPPHLEAQILHWEQGWCNLSLVCTVPGAGNVSYSWSCNGDPLGTLEPQPWLHLQLRGDANPTVCSCNVSNPVSWGVESTDLVATCLAAAPGLFSLFPRWAVVVSLGLALVISVAFIVTCYWWRKRRKDPPGALSPEHVEQALTVYEEVGKTRPGQTPNDNSDSTGGGNTIYAVISTKTLGRNRPQEPQSSTIYSTVQPTRKSPSLKRKRLNPALVSTAYVEATGGPRHRCPPS